MPEAEQDGCAYDEAAELHAAMGVCAAICAASPAHHSARLAMAGWLVREGAEGGATPADVLTLLQHEPTLEAAIRGTAAAGLKRMAWLKLRNACQGA
ncbi:hypothetical protein ABPG75_010710 [Micractinium tetrahymenae]